MQPIQRKTIYPAKGDGTGTAGSPAEAMLAIHEKNAAKLERAKSAILELCSAKQAHAMLLKHAKTGSPAGRGVVLGSMGMLEEAFQCAEMCTPKYEKGLIYAACGQSGAENAEQNLAFLALYLKAGGLNVPEELVAKASGYRLASEPSEALVRLICTEGSLLALSIDPLDTKILAAWANMLSSKGLYAEAGGLFAKAQDRDSAIKCAVELTVKANALFDQKAEKQDAAHFRLAAEAGIILAEIGKYDEARKKAKNLRKHPTLQGLVLARCDDSASKSAAWDIAMRAVEKGRSANAVSEIFSILGDAPHAAEAAIRASGDSIFGPFAMLRAARACRVSLGLAEAECRKISQADFEQIVLEAKGGKNELFLGKMMIAAPRMFAEAVERLQMQP